MDYFQHVNWLAVLVAAVAAFLLGGVWFSSFMFEKQWTTALGKPKEEMGMPGPAMGLSFVTTLVTATVIAVILGKMPLTTPLGAARLGAAIGIGIVAMGMASDFAFTGRSRKLYWIQAGYRVLALTLMGVIIGLWH